MEQYTLLRVVSMSQGRCGFTTYAIVLSVLCLLPVLDICVGFWILCDTVDQYTARYRLWGWCLGVFLFLTVSTLVVFFYHASNHDINRSNTIKKTRRTLAQTSPRGYIVYFLTHIENVIALLMALVALVFFIWGTYIYAKLSPSGAHDHNYHRTLWIWFQVNYWVLAVFLLLQFVTQTVMICYDFCCSPEFNDTPIVTAL